MTLSYQNWKWSKNLRRDVLQKLDIPRLTCLSRRGALQQQLVQEAGDGDLAAAGAQAPPVRGGAHLPGPQHLPRPAGEPRPESPSQQGLAEPAAHHAVPRHLPRGRQDKHLQRADAQRDPRQDRGGQHCCLQQGHPPDPPHRADHVGWQHLVLAVLRYQKTLPLVLHLLRRRGERYFLRDRTRGGLQHFLAEHSKLHLLPEGIF